MTETMTHLERQTSTPSGFVTLRRIVERDGSFARVLAYMADDRTHVWRREAGESASEFEARVIDEAEWISVERGVVVAIMPLELENKL